MYESAGEDERAEQARIASEKEATSAIAVTDTEVRTNKATTIIISC